MSAIIMRCTSKQEHPNADSLFVYSFSDGYEKYQIVANNENNYEINDCAIVVLANSYLKGGEKIKSTKIRGVRSQGMAIGKSDLQCGTNVSDIYCDIIATSNFIAWPDTELLYNVCRDISGSEFCKTIKYRAKIKLHGTNSSVQFQPNGNVIAQSRNRIITVDDDNYGFAKFVSESGFRLNNKSENTIVVYGELCGSGIQNGVAISEIGKRIFCVFAVLEQIPGKTLIHYEPEKISEFISESDDIFILPWASDVIELNFKNDDELKTQINVINNMVNNIEAEDPWVKLNFGVSGIGEGIVMYPVLNDSGSINYDDFSDLFFKAKGSQHRAVKSKLPAQTKPELAANVQEFIDLFCTESRLEQIMQKTGGVILKNTKTFIDLFVEDVKKESSAELQESGLVFSDIHKSLSTAAAKWWKDKCSESMSVFNT